MKKISELEEILELKIDPPKYLDASGYAKFRRCPLAYVFSRLVGFYEGAKPAPDFGTAIHAAMYHAQRGQKNQALRAFSDSWSKSGHEDTDKHNIGVATRILDQVDKDIRLRPYTIIPPPLNALRPEESFSDDEFAFCVDVGSPLLLAGRIDAIGEDRDGKIWLIEYKTTSEAGTRFINAFRINSQIQSYHLASSIFLAEPPAGTFLEGLRVSSANPCNIRIPIHYNLHQVETFLQDYKLASKQILDMFSDDYIPQVLSNCSPYNGFATLGYNCPFLDMCLNSNGVEAFKGAFVIKKWHPFEDFSDDSSINDK